MKDWNEVLVHRAEVPNRNYFKSIVLKEPTKPETVKIIRMSDVELTPVEWFWKPYLPFGKLSVLQGNPGEGKTYFAMHLAAACTNGKLLPNMERMEHFNVIYQTAEDGLGDTVKPRLIEAGADLDRVLVIDDSDVQLTLSDERIEKAIVENNDRLVIIDPIQAYLGADVDMNRANEVRPIFIIRLDNSLNNFPERINSAENELATLHQQQAAAQIEVEKPFPQEEELAEKSARLAELNAQLDVDEKSHDPEEEQPDEDAPRRPSVLAALEEKSDKPEPVKPFRSYYDKDGDAR